ncbi:Zinc finger BED domain-containing protein RICESLEEPER 2 [Bienertia sinuspersici]
MPDQDQQNFDVNGSTEKQKIVCKYCKHEMKAAGHVGTTNARRHTEKCDAYAKFVKTNPASNVVYDHDTYVRMFDDSIIYHGYALSMVEHIKTRDLHRYLNPKLSEIVKFIDSSDVRLSAFDKAILDREDHTSFRGNFVLDVTTRWNSTYNMFCRAVDANEAIDLFILHPTSSSYLACVINIEKLLYDFHKDPSNAVRKMAKPMWEKFDKYWSEHSLILSFGLLLDPRYKMACLNVLYSSLYVPIAVEGKINEIHNVFVDLYECYAKNSQAHVVVQDSSSNSGPSNLNRPFKVKRILKNFDLHSCSSRTTKSDVDSYLNLPFIVDHDGFDILEYYKA